MIQQSLLQQRLYGFQAKRLRLKIKSEGGTFDFRPKQKADINFDVKQ